MPRAEDGPFERPIRGTKVIADQARDESFVRTVRVLSTCLRRHVGEEVHFRNWRSRLAVVWSMLLGCEARAALTQRNM